MLLRFLAVAAMALAAVAGRALDMLESYAWLWAYPLLSVGFLLIELLGCFLYLLWLCKRTDMDREQEEDDAHCRKVVELYLESALPALRIDITTRGMEKVPHDRRFLLVCNHCNNADPVILLHVFAGYQIAFISKKENRDMFVVGPVMHRLLCQMIDRENDRAALLTILKCIRILKEDKASIGLFPEGYVHKDRKLHHFRAGAFKIAQKAQVPIVVCTLKNTRDTIVNLAHYRRTPVELTVLDTIGPEELAGQTTVQIAQRIYEMMAQDLGPENVAQEEA